VGLAAILPIVRKRQEANMSNRTTFRVAVLGTPQTEQWLLVHAFASTRGRQCTYELVADAAVRRPDMYVVDSENDHAVARWATLDPKGSVPAAFFSRVHPRAKSGVVVPRPLTSGSVVDALDQLVRRFLEDSDVPLQAPRPAARELALAAA
jgi:hypothetical protein